jgi:hypothetical protein
MKFEDEISLSHLKLSQYPSFFDYSITTNGLAHLDYIAAVGTRNSYNKEISTEEFCIKIHIRKINYEDVREI